MMMPTPGMVGGGVGPLQSGVTVPPGMLPQVGPASVGSAPPNRVTIKHITTTEDPSGPPRTVSSMEHRPSTRLPGQQQHGEADLYHNQQQHPGEWNGKLERQWSHPNLRPRPGAVNRRQLPKTPTLPAGTIIVIENIVKEKGGKKTLPTPPVTSSMTPRRCGSTTGLRRGLDDDDPTKRSFSLPRRQQLCRSSSVGRTLPARPGTAAAANVAAAKSAAAVAANAVATGNAIPPKNAPPIPACGPKGRRLPPTPHQSSLALHHTPGIPHKRELPKPQSLDLRVSNRDLLMRTGRMSSRSMNFPRVERSPSRSGGESSLEDPVNYGPDYTVEDLMGYPLPSVPPGLRTNMYRNRRTLLE